MPNRRRLRCVGIADELRDLYQELIRQEKQQRKFSADVARVAAEMPGEPIADLHEEVAFGRATLDDTWARWEQLARKHGVIATCPAAVISLAAARRGCPRPRGAGRPAARRTVGRAVPSDDSELADDGPIAMVLVNEHTGARIIVQFGRRELSDKEAMRRLLYRAGCDPPPWTDEEFADVVEVLHRLADAEERGESL